MTYRELLEITKKYPNPFSYHTHNRVYEYEMRRDNTQKNTEYKTTDKKAPRN